MIITNVARMDPTRMATLRRVALAEIARRYARLKAAVTYVIKDLNTLGVVANVISVKEVLRRSAMRGISPEEAHDDYMDRSAAQKLLAVMYPAAGKPDLAELLDQYHKLGRRNYPDEDMWRQVNDAWAAMVKGFSLKELEPLVRSGQLDYEMHRGQLLGGTFPAYLKEAVPGLVEVMRDKLGARADDEQPAAAVPVKVPTVPDPVPVSTTTVSAPAPALAAPVTVPEPVRQPVALPEVSSPVAGPTAPAKPIPRPVAIKPPVVRPASPVRPAAGTAPVLSPGGVARSPGSWAHDTNPNKVKRFRAWLREEIGSTLAGDELLQHYIDLGYRKGTERAFDDLRRGPGNKEGELKRAGAKEEFTRIAMTRHATVDKVKLLASRTFHDLEDINTRMSAVMSRVLVDGLVQGWSPAKIARQMVAQVDIDQGRAMAIVRTELVRAHAEGQLDALDLLGEKQVGVMAEWRTAGDNKVCKKCGSLEGKVFDISEARGMLPLHPNCRCAWLPLKRKGK